MYPLPNLYTIFERVQGFHAVQVSFLNKLWCGEERDTSEAESKEKHGVWDPVPELTITSTLCTLQSRPQHINMGNPMAESTLIPRSESTFSPQGFWIWPQKESKREVQRS